MQVLHDELLARHTTLRVGGPAARFVTAESEPEIIEHLCKDEQVFNLARSIAEAGPNPLELVGVVVIGDAAFIAHEDIAANVQGTIYAGGGIYDVTADAAIATGALGAFWAVVYLRRRSIVAPMVSHAGFNVLELARAVAAR